MEFLSDDELKELENMLKLWFEWNGLSPRFVLMKKIERRLLELVVEVDRDKNGAKELWLNVESWLEQRAAEHSVQPTCRIRRHLQG